MSARLRIDWRQSALSHRLFSKEPMSLLQHITFYRVFNICPLFLPMIQILGRDYRLCLMTIWFDTVRCVLHVPNGIHLLVQVQCINILEIIWKVEKRSHVLLHFYSPEVASSYEVFVVVEIIDLSRTCAQCSIYLA